MLSKATRRCEIGYDKKLQQLYTGIKRELFPSFLSVKEVKREKRSMLWRRTI